MASTGQEGLEKVCIMVLLILYDIGLPARKYCLHDHYFVYLSMTMWLTEKPQTTKGNKPSSNVLLLVRSEKAF